MGHKGDTLHRLMIGREPDLTVLIEVNPSTGLERAKGRDGGEERFEDFGMEFQERLREGFLKLAERFDYRFRVVDGNRTPDAVAVDVMAHAHGALA